MLRISVNLNLYVMDLGDLLFLRKAFLYVNMRVKCYFMLEFSVLSPLCEGFSNILTFCRCEFIILVNILVGRSAYRPLYACGRLL